MEFVGDGVLNCVTADLLFRRFDQLSEGELSRLRANLVRQETLARVATAVDLGAYLRLGEGELRSGGRSRPSILADALEAVLGAVYLDGGYVAAQAVVGRLFGASIDGIDLSREIKDPKTRLQEHLQARKLPLPVYVVENATGEQHVQEFFVSCSIPRLGIITRASGSSRRIAEQRAAEDACKLVEAKGNPQGGRR
jgi:ribonuclease-3